MTTIHHTSKVALIILDGWGVTHEMMPSRSAPAAAHTPFLDHLYATAPRSVLQASEEAVGLPAGQVGNSEVWHTTLWAWRVKYQDLVKISRAVQDNILVDNAVLREAVAYAQREHKNIHLMWLLSDGGVHSHISHVFGLLDALSTLCEQPIYVHAFADGRDTDPMSCVWYIKEMQHRLKTAYPHVYLTSIVWRYYAMDRDQRWERVKVAYDLLVDGVGECTDDPVATLQTRYAAGETDEFLKPIRCLRWNRGVIEPGDVVIFWNFRSDRAREITSCLTQQEYVAYAMHPIPDVKFVCMSQYDATFHDVEVLFPPESLEEVLWSVLSTHGKTQLRIAETEKYPHVTFFFNGGEETPYPWEHRILVPSPKVATYDLQPEMSASEVTALCMAYVREEQPDFVCLNYANPDMVWHTWVFEAVVRACETIDTCAKELCLFLETQWYTVIMLADHGNADYMINDDGTPNTAHSLALVPCFVLVPGWSAADVHVRAWTLADVAPTVLDIMDIEKPSVMTGTSLLTLS